MQGALVGMHAAFLLLVVFPVVVLDAGFVVAQILLWFEGSTADDGVQASRDQCCCFHMSKALSEAPQASQICRASSRSPAFVYALGQFTDRRYAAHEDEVLVFVQRPSGRIEEPRGRHSSTCRPYF